MSRLIINAIKGELLTKTFMGILLNILGGVSMMVFMWGRIPGLKILEE